MLHCRPFTISWKFGDCSDIVLWEVGKGNKERHNTGDVRGYNHFLVYSVRAAEANNRKEDHSRIQNCLQKNMVCAMHSFLLL